MDLTGKVALVTGASKGLGETIAANLARRGARVGVNYAQDHQGAMRTVQGIQQDGGEAVSLQADVADVGAVREMVRRLIDTWGRIDILVNNAGITSWGPFADYTEEAWDRVVATNLKGAYFCTQAVVRELIRQGTGGRIIIISSIMGMQAARYLSAYAMTKGGLQMLTRNLVLELSPHQITINSIGVGLTMVERNLRDDPEYGDKWGRVIPLGRTAVPQDVAGLVSFLCTPEADYITGANIMVDGGWTCHSPSPEFEFVEQEGRIGT